MPNPKNPPDRYSIAARLKEARDAAGLNQLDLAARLGIPQSRVSEYERGIREPGSITLWRLAQALGVSTDSLLGS